MQRIQITLQFSLLLLAIISIPANASQRPNNRDIGIEASAGIPELVGLRLSYLRISHLILGGGFGTFPVNSFLKSKIQLSPTPIQMSSGGPYNMYPSATYTVMGFHAFLKYFPFESGWFSSFEYASLGARGVFSGDLKNESTGKISGGALSGDFQYTQPILAFTLGYEFYIQQRINISFGIGVGYLPKSTYTLSMGGTASSIAPLDPVADQSFENSKQEIQAQTAAGVAALQNSFKFIPSIYLTIGWLFDL